ncbi:hypothetical protein DN069_00815 [Streptacidiphilus pinicola]|uniref:Autotransporter n=1 Tax=Streptacidiphilus pinicola TaxID=2219663 RepID=A0A2X0KEU6_9ACTN|nr:hypothetical protein [Streptacidiphilus pinicola]RAG87565.1 hypothetical protein DN069_00815 [Streptacidiphilus pinicola]
MKHARLGLGAALVTCAFVGTALVQAPLAGAVSPDSATISFDCGSYGSGSATLTATQDGTNATITVTTSAITAPIAIGANSVSSDLTMTNSDGSTAVFSGSANPDIPAGSPVSTGPLSGTVAAGDSLSATSMTVSVFGITATCTATSAQSPGPFTY